MSRNELYSSIRLAMLRLRRKLPARKSPFIYVAIGDSTVEGVGASDSQHTYASLVHAAINQQFKHAKLHNFGKGGARVRDVIENQLNQAIAAQPNLVTLSVGANDIVRNTSAGKFRRQFTGLIRKLREETAAVIVVTNVPNFALTPAIPRPLKPLAELRIRRINAVIRSVATAYDLILIDAFRYASAFMRQFPDTYLYEDGFHPSDAGYALWATSILTILQGKLS